ncbi:MOSC domain-containing protein [Pseudomonas sp. IC_126]|uniref:MOSC domain-containing protein n=1 Tax=Pseudomonas sp. IC_126 TaxID=2547400 RepID=UPI00103AF1AB|nr:MOSC domain-containing protein [Pseudomonas sp. IC_126]TCD20044.1 MOSC domain-containing protein [Pseudomonas sp. IC_126]
MQLARIEQLLVGKAAPYTRSGTRSAIAKHAVAGPVPVGFEGLEGDEQGDRKVHGGVNKAVHHYAYEHYSRWREQLGALPLLEQPGAFGENISTRGLSEADLCLGDVLRCGEARLEVVQTRQPCWKLNDRFGIPDMALRVQQSGMTGWYYKVLEPGALEAGQLLILEHRPFPRWSLTRVLEVLYQRTLDQTALHELNELPLVPSWRKLVERRLQQHTVEDWSKRLYGSNSET